MFGVIISVVIALGFWFFPSLMVVDLAMMQIVSITVGLVFFTLFGLTTAFTFSPMQKVEQNLTPRLLELFREDRHLRLIGLWTVLFVIGSIFFGLIGFRIGDVNPSILVIAWIVASGITFDLYRHFLFRLSEYLNPYAIIQLFTQRAKEAIQNDYESDLCNYIDALTEVGMKSLQRSSTSLCNNAVDELQHLTKIYLDAAKDISHHNSEKISFTLFYIFQRLEMINNKAVEMKLEPIASGLVTSVGKISIYAAQCDLSLVSFPLYFLGKFALASQEQGLSEVGVRAICTLLEVGKEILEKVDVQYAELQDPYFSLIGQLEVITKEMFRQDKSMSFKILNQPFLDLKELLTSDKMADHPDTASITADLDRILDEFSNLEMVMKTVPPVSKEVQS